MLWPLCICRGRSAPPRPWLCTDMPNTSCTVRLACEDDNSPSKMVACRQNGLAVAAPFSLPAGRPQSPLP